jgi:hypothetical protein
MLLPLLAMALIGSGQGGGQFPDTPENHWAYEAISYLQAEGILVGYPAGLGPGLPEYKSRYELAVTVNAAACHLSSLTKGLAMDLNEMNQRASVFKRKSNLVKQVRDELKAFHEPLFQKAVGYLEKCGTEFAPELSGLGVRPGALSDSLREYRRFLLDYPVPAEQFSDVPANHWAARAVVNLRTEEVLAGYPDGKFRG